MIDKVLNILRKLVPRKIFKFFRPVYHFLLAITGNIIYRFPGRKMICIGVTGTNGKSTTVEIINSILKTAGYKTGMISTIAFEVAGDRKDNITAKTTLGRWQTQKLLRKMVKAKCEYAVIEAASEGIVQFRTWGIPFDAAVFTNLSPEHLNTHGNMTNYRNAKGKLFANLSLTRVKKLKVKSKKDKIKKVSVVNADDKEARYFSAFPADMHLGYGLKRGEVRAKNISQNDKLFFDIVHQNKKYSISSELLASFNTYNILAAWCVGFSQGIEPKKIKEGIEAVKSVRGRFEKVAEKNNISYYIDYAVTPDAFELLFRELRKIANGKIISVFGATGDRDKSKRQALGEVAVQMTDITIITDEESYSEKPEEIIKQIAEGAEKVRKENVYKITDRKKALKKAVELAGPGDVVVATGLGHQKYRNIGGNKKTPWNEAEIIKELLK